MANPVTIKDLSRFDGKLELSNHQSYQGSIPKGWKVGDTIQIGKADEGSYDRGFELLSNVTVGSGTLATPSGFPVKTLFEGIVTHEDTFRSTTTFTVRSIRVSNEAKKSYNWARQNFVYIEADTRNDEQSYLNRRVWVEQNRSTNRLTVTVDNKSIDWLRIR